MANNYIQPTQLNRKMGNYILDNGNEMGESVERQAGEGGIEITQEMIRAGVRVLTDRYDVATNYLAETLAEEVFKEMIDASASRQR